MQSQATFCCNVRCWGMLSMADAISTRSPNTLLRDERGRLHMLTPTGWRRATMRDRFTGTYWIAGGKPFRIARLSLWAKITGRGRCHTGEV
jgi:hypothetical protein